MRSRVRSALVGLLALGMAACTPDPEPDGTDASILSFGDAGLDSIDAGPPCAPTVDFVAALGDSLAPARRLPGRVTLLSSRSPEPHDGMKNDDFAHFVGVDGTHVVLADEDGPGVITRLWFTYGPPSTGTVSDVPLRLIVDGRDVIEDVPLGTLASSSSTVFPAPWSMDETVSSGGLSISSPIQFQHHVRVELTVARGSWAYYQIDLRRLPGQCVRSFDGDYTQDDRDELTHAALIWCDHYHPGVESNIVSRVFAPGESTELALAGIGAITTLEVTTPRGTRADLGVRIEVDGEVAAEAPLAWLTGSDSPAGTYSAALTASSDTSAILYAPIPCASSARIVVTNHASASVDVGLRALWAPLGSIPENVGRFHAECGSSVASIPVPTEQPPFGDMFPNVVLAQTARGPGQFAGITMFQIAPNPWWWALEPDHEVAIDGSYDILGTGTEDYFGGGFYFRNGPYTSVTSGASGWDRPDGTVMPIPDAHTHVYRHHLVDTWPFDHELRFEMESYVDGTQWDGCAFFYLFP